MNNIFKKENFKKVFTISAIVNACFNLLLLVMYFSPMFKILMFSKDLSFPEIFEASEHTSDGIENFAMIMNCVMIVLAVLSVASVFEPFMKKDFSKIRSMILPIVSAVIYLAMIYIQTHPEGQAKDYISLNFNGVLYIIAGIAVIAASIFMMILIIMNRKNQ